MIALILTILLAFKVQLFDSFIRVFSYTKTKYSSLNNLNKINVNNKHDSEKIDQSCQCSRQVMKTNMLSQDQIAEGFSNAFVGGTVGVMSVAFILEAKKLNEKSIDSCPYCLGNGEILCAFCLGQGIGFENESCQCCSGRGLVICLNCKGDGRETPIMLQSKAVRNPEYASDGISIDSA